MEATVDTTIETIKAAGLEPSELAGIYLVGGSSKIPLVAARLWSRTGIQPSVQGDPKTVGSTRCVRVAPAQAGDRQSGHRPHLPEQPGHGYSRLLLEWRRLLLRIPHGHPGRWNGVGDLLRRACHRQPRPDRPGRRRAAVGPAGYQELSVEQVDWLGRHGVERWFATEDPAASEWVERYVVVGDRSIVGLAPAALASRLDAVSYRTQTLAPDRFYQLPLSTDLTSGDRVHERLELIRAGSDYRVTAESYELDSAVGESRIAAYQSHPAYTSLGQTMTRMLGQSNKTWMLGIADGVPGQMHSFWSTSESANPLHTRIWIGQAVGRSYSLVATLPANQKINFKLLFAHATLATAETVPSNRKLVKSIL